MKLPLPLIFLVVLLYACSSSQSLVDQEFANLNKLIEITDVVWADDFSEVSFTLTNKSETLHYPLVVISISFTDGSQVLGQEQLRVYPEPILAPGASERYTRQLSPDPAVVAASQGVQSSWALKPYEVDKFDKMVKTGPGY